MVYADAAPTPAIKTNNAKPNEVRFTALPSYPSTSFFLLQVFARRLIEINAPARHSRIKRREAAKGSLSENAIKRSVARTAPASIRAAGSDIAGPAVRAGALACHLFDDRGGVLHERMNARSDRSLSVRRHVDRNQEGCRSSQSHREFPHHILRLIAIMREWTTWKYYAASPPLWRRSYRSCSAFKDKLVDGDTSASIGFPHRRDSLM